MANYDILDWLQVNFQMSRHDFTISDIEDCLPWERKLYIAQLQKYLKDQKDNG